MGFVKVALPFALMQVLLATFYLLLLGWLGAVS